MLIYVYSYTILESVADTYVASNCTMSVSELKKLLRHLGSYPSTQHLYIVRQSDIVLRGMIE